MIKDRIIQMDDGQNYYVLEEVEYKNKKYVLSLECDLDKDEINEDDYLIMEIVLVENDIVIKNIDNNVDIKIIASMLFDKMKKEK